ncbi:MAG: D-alanine--D-alanine ligase, partial [Actinomycetota bacterium]
LDADVGVPQMFCPAGLVDHRSLLALLGIPSIGNSATVMAMTADKSVARAVVAAAGVDVPAAVLVRRGERAPAFERPVVVKPVDADNSTGVELVERTSELAPAIAAALDLSDAALVEDFVPLGREVRCGTIRRDGHVMALPLEEYAVDPVHAPIRREHDKLADDGDGLRLVAKNDTRAWIVPDATPDATDGDRDPVTAAVQDMALTVHRALGCSHHGLIDVRIDPSGRPWFLEAGPYCSFAPSSVVVMMAAAAGIDLAELFSDAVDVALDRTPIGASR